MGDAIGSQWLLEQYQIQLVQPLLVQSSISTGRSTHAIPPVTQEYYPPVMRPTASLVGHLTFALKHEPLHLEFFARLFPKIAEAEIREWIQTEPTGQYARRAAFYWEWFNGCQLAGVPNTTKGSYIDLIDSAKYVVAVDPVRVPRWRIHNNLLGGLDFCPLISRTKRVKQAEQYDLAGALNALNIEFGYETLVRSAQWLTVKESRASFEIEHESQKQDRVQRFAQVMQAQCGQHPNPLEPNVLAQLQQAIMGEVTTLSQFGLRQSPVFVGERSRTQEEIVHYIAPAPEQVPGLLDGLQAALHKTFGVSPLVRAAMLAFGFIYIHPLADGNGRIHRFLVNDSLRRDKVTAAPFILPISATITQSAKTHTEYDRALEAFSRSLMARYQTSYEFVPYAEAQTYADGIKSNFLFADYADALPAWQYIDLTAQTEYLFTLLRSTVEGELRSEAKLLQAWDKAFNAIQSVLDGPRQNIDRIIRSVRETGGVSNVLKKEFPVLDDEGLAQTIVVAVNQAFIELLSETPRQVS